MLAVIRWIIVSDSGLPAFQDHLNLPPQVNDDKNWGRARQPSGDGVLVGRTCE